MVKAEICLNGESLVLGLFGIHFSNAGSSISRVLLPLKENKDFLKREALYTSELNDLGHLVCNLDNENIVFIKNVGTSSIPSFDAANLNSNNKKITPLSEIKTLSNIINMDGTLLTEEKGKYYIVKGDADYKSIDSLKAKPETKVENKIEDKKVMEGELEDE